MTTFLIIYLLIAIFALGSYLGASIERNDKLSFSDTFSMGVLAAFWPCLLGALIYIWLKDKTK